MTDSLERFLEDLRFEVPVGLAHRAKAAAASNSHARRAGMNWQRQPWALTLVAALLALAIVATLILGARSLHPRAVVPGGHVPPSTFVASDPIPPSLASNGWIAYSTSSRVRGATDITTGSDIYLVRAGVEPRLIAGRDGGTVRNVCPTFSPDGRRLAYGVDAAGGRTLVVLGVDPNGEITARARFQIPGSGSTVCPRWSLDGTHVAYLEGGRVLVRGLDGQTVASVAGDPGVDDFGLERPYDASLLSPQGDRIARVQIFNIGCQVVVSRPDGTSPVIIPLPFPGGCAYALPTWSPDGRQVLIMQDVSGMDFTILAVAVDDPLEIVTIVSTVRTNGARSWPGWGDVSWQPVVA